ncbi:MAG TPA: hypothetical protein VJ142_02660 [Candidatus Nanoarchaeia archaeon]|nr:hypothetical protein [Candidatus Nanoarchaeia archaeon]
MEINEKYRGDGAAVIYRLDDRYYCILAFSSEELNKRLLDLNPNPLLEDSSPTATFIKRFDGISDEALGMLEETARTCGTKQVNFESLLQ